MDFLRNIDRQTFLRLIALGLALVVIYHLFFNKSMQRGGASRTMEEEEEKNMGDEESGGKAKNLFGGKYANDWISTGFGYGYGEMNPSERLLDIVKEFGPPDIFDPKKGGGAIWYKSSLKGTPYERVEIRDEQIPHDKPAKHTDFLYSWYKIDVPEHKIGGLHKISKSISYDPLKKMMSARCHDMRPNVVTHWVVKKYAEGVLTIDEAAGMYGPMVMELFEKDPKNVKYRQLEREL